MINKALLIDDDPRYSEFLKEILEEEFLCNVDNFKTADMAIKSLSAGDKNYDIILLDYNLTLDHKNGDYYYSRISDLFPEYKNKTFLVTVVKMVDFAILKKDLISFLDGYFATNKLRCNLQPLNLTT